MASKTNFYMGLALFIASIALLIPGLTLPLVSVEIKMDMSSVPLFGSMLGQQELQSKTMSILQVIRDLASQDLVHVALLLTFFCVVIPVSKALLTVSGLLFKKPRIVRIANTLSKWAMADVFVIALLIAYFYMQGFAMIRAYIHVGYYFFTAYVIVSIISAQFFARFYTQLQASEGGAAH